jgi:hypothetical protein
MKLYTVTNNQTGVTRGLDLKQTVDLVYFDAIQECINQNPDDYDNDEIKAIMGGWDIGWYTDIQNELDQIAEAVTVGRYTVTPIA